MTDITKIPVGELDADLSETKVDIVICQRSLDIGITEYSGNGSVQRRLDTNLKIESLIEKELKRRNQNDRPSTDQKESEPIRPV